MATGRGAWTHIGGTTPYYELTRPRVGHAVLSNPALDPDSYAERAVNYGVRAIQHRLNDLGLADLTVTGNFGRGTRKGVKAFQASVGLTTDGVVGPTTAKALFRPCLIAKAEARKVDPALAFGIVSVESVFDPGAVGYSTPGDKGFAQFNTTAGNNTTWWNKNPVEFTVENAFDHIWAFTELANRLAWAKTEFSGKGTQLRRECMILQHNSPKAAYDHFAGYDITPEAQSYLSNVLSAMQNF